MESGEKAMIVSCDFAFCIHNVGGKCKHDKIKLSVDGVCEESLDRLKLYLAQKSMENKENI